MIEIKIKRNTKTDKLLTGKQNVRLLAIDIVRRWDRLLTLRDSDKHIF